MSLVIVPNSLSNEIYRRIDEQIEGIPEIKDSREDIYRDLLAYYNEHGQIPDFTLKAS